MAITTLPTKTDGSIGRVKRTAPAAEGITPNLDYFTTAAEFDALKDAVVNVSASVGLTSGATPFSIEAKLIPLVRHELGLSVKVTGDSVKPEDDVCIVDTTPGSVTLTVDPSTYPRSILVKKINTSTNKITITPPSGWSIEAGATNASVDLPDSNTANRYAWTLVVQPATSKIWIA